MHYGRHIYLPIYSMECSVSNSKSSLVGKYPLQSPNTSTDTFIALDLPDGSFCGEMSLR